MSRLVRILFYLLSGRLHQFLDLIWSPLLKAWHNTAGRRLESFRLGSPLVKLKFIRAVKNP